MARFQLIAACVLSLGMGGCVVSGPGMGGMVDAELVTGSISRPDAASPNPDMASDERTVRNAVSAADIDGGESRHAWANPQTGANGVVTAIRESRDGSRICRSFQTSRQRFDGIALYHGEACTVGEGEWALVSFNEAGS
ncbi:MAG TPA: RT0821/Lpp0805 family surface protein [Aurantimonas sp.]|jgi:surface antigen|nr:RT0821/Lpp0805 family surface protein [Aurantimonas sp.]